MPSTDPRIDHISVEATSSVAVLRKCNEWTILALVLVSLALTMWAAQTRAQGAGQAKPTPSTKPLVRSTVYVYDLRTGKSTSVYSAVGFYEAPFWSRDGASIYFNGGPDNKLYRVPAGGGDRQAVDVGGVSVDHDHGFSPDGKWHALNVGADLCVSTADGKDLRPITSTKNAFYFHNWSPDSLWLAGTGQSPEHSYDVYRIALDGTHEGRLTTSPAFDDGPDYSPDGKWIYFNTDRTGSFDIWRMPATGAGPNDKFAEPVTSDAPEDWFPHPSPDGKWLLFASYPAGTHTSVTLAQWLKAHPGESINIYNLTMHPYNGKATIRIIPLPGDKVQPVEPRVLVHIIGGQGSLNLNSWAPDSQRFAYVSFTPLNP